MSGIEANPGPPITSTTNCSSGTIRNIKFGCYNIRSAVHKAAILHDLIYDNSIDILALSETWIRPDAPPAIARDIAPDNYNVLHVHRPMITGGPATGGGLAIIYSNSVSVRAHPLSESVTPSLCELQLVKVTSGAKSITLINIYRPPSHTLCSTFFDELSDIIGTVIAGTTDPVLLCGDLNCPGAVSSEVDARLADVFATFGLIQHVQSPTRDANLLDVIAADHTLAVADVEVSDAGLASDHRLVTAKLALQPSTQPAVPVKFRRIANIDADEFQSALRRSSLYTSPAATADEFARQLADVVTSELDAVAPVKTHYRRPAKKSTKWLSPEAITAKRHRRKLERIWRSTGLDADRAAYRKYCRQTNVIITASRRNFIRSQLEESADPKKRWRVVKNVLHNDTRSCLPLADCTRLCTTFAQFFVDKINTIKQNVAHKLSNLPHIPLTDCHHTGNKLDTLQPVTVNEVQKVLSHIPAKSSPLDYIPTSLIKLCSPTFSELIAYLANLSFQEGCFPSSFTRAIVTPVLKKFGLDSSSPSNYRPISNLNNVSKILERLFLTRLQPHVTTSTNFNPLQSAYRQAHSTETALVNTLDYIYTSAGHSQPTILVSLDLSAAFDTINHHTLLTRLQHSFGVTGTALKWIKSYLSNRTQSVAMGTSQSHFVSLDTGVPQGSVLGPLLFSTYTSPVGQLIKSFGILHQQYADDTQLFISISPTAPTDSVHLVEQCLAQLHYWFCLNGLALNPDKSEAIWFSTWQRSISLPPVSSVNIAGSTIPISSSIKTLGVTLDNHLSLNQHVSSVCKSSYFHLRALRHIRSVLTEDMAKSIAVALVSSRLDYANSVLFGTSAANLHKIQRVQNTLAKIVLNNTSLPSATALRQLHWLPVKQRIHFKIATLTYRTLQSGSPSYLSSLININIPHRPLRSSSLNLLHVPLTTKAVGRKAFRFSAPTVWNSIPQNIRLSSSIDSFKRNLKTYLFSLPG